MNNYDQIIKFDISLLKDLLDIDNEPIRIHHHLLPIVKSYSRDQEVEAQTLNALQQNANEWVAQIQTILQNEYTGENIKDYQIKSGEYQDKLQKVMERLRSADFQTVFEILKQRKRFHNFHVIESQVLDRLDSVRKIHFVLKDFPIDQILQATTIRDLNTALSNCFAHLLRKLKLKFILEKWIIEQLDREITKKLTLLLGDVLRVDYFKFLEMNDQTSSIFESWDENYQEFITLVRDNSRKEGQRFVPFRIDLTSTKIKIRMNFFANFRKDHQVIAESLEAKSVRNAIEPFAKIDAFDDNLEKWNAAEKNYLDKIAIVEADVISELKAELKLASTTHQMYLIFKKNQKLLSRPAIRGALMEYQIKLVESVFTEVANLHEIYSVGSKNNLELSASRDIPELAGKIMFARNIEHRLKRLMEKIKEINFDSWSTSVQNQKLIELEKRLLILVDTTSVLKTFVDAQMKNQPINGFVLIATKRSALGKARIAVNFDPDKVTCFKNVKALTDLGLSLPLSIQTGAKDARRLYPFVISLENSLRIYSKISESIEGSRIDILCASVSSCIQRHLYDNITLKWDTLLALSYSESRPKVITKLAELSTKIESDAQQCKIADEIIFGMIEKLGSCAYERREFDTLLSGIQKEVLFVN